MIAIQTKYIPATNSRGSRIKAFTSNGQSLVISYDYGLEDYELYKKAAIALCKKMDWSENIIGGATKDGYTFVFLPSEMLVLEKCQECGQKDVFINSKCQHCGEGK